MQGGPSPLTTAPSITHQHVIHDAPAKGTVTITGTIEGTIMWTGDEGMTNASSSLHASHEGQHGGRRGGGHQGETF